MRNRKLKIGIIGLHELYKSNILIKIIAKLTDDNFEFTKAEQADLVIYGPYEELFARRNASKNIFKKLINTKRKRKIRGVKLFHTGENTRHNLLGTKYALSFDLGVASEKHLRFPLWMESIDWSHEGIHNNHNMRINRLLQIEELMTPLGKALLERPRQAALFTSHFREPRKTLFHALSAVIPTKGFGRPFNKKIRNHNESGFFKDQVLSDFQFNLCPENTLYPGYYTEKTVEAYGAGCQPITWADQNLRVDFNPEALINALEFADTGYEAGLREALTPAKVRERSEVPLLRTAPTLEPMFEFMKTVLKDAQQ